MENPEPTIDELVASEAARHRKSYRRTSLLVLLVILIGTVWIFVSAISVSRLEGRATELNKRAEGLQKQSEALTEEIKTKQADLDKKTREVEEKQTALIEIDWNLSDRKGKESDALRIASTAIEKTAIDKTAVDKPPGFVGGQYYKGPNGTNILVEVIPEGLNNEGGRTIYTYALDGKNYFKPPAANKIAFRLTKPQTQLVLFLEFAHVTRYTIKASADSGVVRSRSFPVTPPVSGVTKTLPLKFVAVK